MPEPYFSMFRAAIPERAAGVNILPGKGFPWTWQHQLVNFRGADNIADWRRYRANYLGMIRLIDDQIKVLLDGLTALDELYNRYLVFVSDQGDFAGDYGLPRKGVSLPRFWSGLGIEAVKMITERWCH